MSDFRALIDDIVQKKMNNVSTFKHCSGTVVEVLEDGKVNVNTQYGTVKVVNRSGKILEIGQVVWIYYWDKLSNGYIGINVNGSVDTGNDVGRFTDAAHTDEIFNDYENNSIIRSSGGFNRISGAYNNLQSGDYMSACSIGGYYSKIKAPSLNCVYMQGYYNSLISNDEVERTAVIGSYNNLIFNSSTDASYDNTIIGAGNNITATGGYRYNFISGIENEVATKASQTVRVDGDNNNISSDLSDIYHAYMYGGYNKITNNSSAIASNIETSMFGLYNKATNVYRCGFFGHSNVITRASESFCLGYSNYINKNAFKDFVFQTIAIGSNNYMYSSNSHAIGRDNYLYANASSVVGSVNNIGSSENIVRCGYVFGESNTINGNYSNTFGYANTVNGNCSSAFGYANIINGDYKIAIGTNATAEDDIAIAFGVKSNPNNMAQGHNAVTIDTSFNLSVNGNISSCGNGYSEVWAWSDENSDSEDRNGLIVTVDGSGIKTANVGEKIIGITSSEPSYISSGSAEEVREKLKLPAYSCVVYLGKTKIIDDGTCVAGDYCSVASGGIATHSETETKIIMLERIDENHIIALLKS